MLSFVIKLSILLFMSVSVLGEECKTPGDVICNEDCTKINVCLGGGHSLVVENCEENYFCYGPTKECSRVHNSCNNTVVYKIMCHGAGFFPDPIDCKWYHTCTGPDVESAPLECQSKRGYNAGTYSCSTVLPDDECLSTPFPGCKSLGQVFVNQENLSIYAICIHDADRGLIHDIWSCESGNNFNIDTYSCPEWSENPNPLLPYMIQP